MRRPYSVLRTSNGLADTAFLAGMALATRHTPRENGRGGHDDGRVHRVNAEQLMLDEPSHPVEPETGQAALEDADGVHLSAETSRRIARDASTVVMRHAPDGTVLDVGRKRRTIPPAIHRALAARDRHCRFPGCTARHCEAHHIWHWSDGGATRLSNLALLCKRHHRAVHEEGFPIMPTLRGLVEWRSPA